MQQSNQAVVYEKWPIWEGEDAKLSRHHVAAVILSRGRQANAFNGEMMAELTALFATIRQDPHCRLLVLMGAGKHFSAGADLSWMAASGELDFAGNKREALGLQRMYEGLVSIDLPTVALVHGATFGGGIGLVACCDIAIAEETSYFCLSEVKLGVIPAVISPFLARKMTKSHIMAYALSARVFSASDALASGLVGTLAPPDDFAQCARDHINSLLSVSLEAQCAFKSLMRKLEESDGGHGDLTAEAIATLRATPCAQKALKAFLAKLPSPFNLRLADDVSIVRR